MVNALQAMQYIQGQGDLGRERGTQNHLARLSSQGYSASPEQQQAILSQAAMTSPAAAAQMQQQFNASEDRTLSQLRGYVDYVNRARQTGRPEAVNAALRAGGPLIQRVTGKTPPTEWTPDMDAGWAELEAKVAMGAAGNSAMPTGFREFDMKARAAGLQPGTKEYEQAAKVALGVEGRAATGGFGFREIEGADGRKRMGRNNPRTGVVEIYDENTGEFVPLGGPAALNGGGPPLLPAGQPGTTFETESGQALPTTRFTAVDGSPVQFDAGVPIEFQQQVLQQPQQFEAAPDGAMANLPTVNRSPQQYRTGNPNLGVSRRPEDEAAAKRAAETAVDLAALPQRQAIETQGAIERKTAEQRVERMPVAVMNTVVELEEKAATASGILDRMKEHRQKINEGKLNFGPIENMKSRAANFTGNSTEQSRNFQLFMSDLEKMRNDSLRLNNGVQTEGDAQRAWNELFANLNDREYVLAGLDRIDRINQRAAELYRNQAANIRAEYPASGTGMYAPAPSDGPGNRLQNTAPVVDGPAVRVQSAADYDAIPSGALYIAPDGSQRRKR